MGTVHIPTSQNGEISKYGVHCLEPQKNGAFVVKENQYQNKDCSGGTITKPKSNLQKAQTYRKLYNSMLKQKPTHFKGIQ